MLLPAPLSREDRGYVVDVIRRSIEREVAGSPDPGPPNASSASRNWRFAMKIAHCAVLSAIIVLTVLTGSYMTLATGIRTMRAGRATEQSDCETELNDSPSGHFRATT